MNNNIYFSEARKNKKNEFYTLYEDISKEMELYKDHLKGKSILCNCDDYRNSNFYKYFIDNFKELELKKLTTIHYVEEGRGLKAEYDGIEERIVELEGNGDFRSVECISILKANDIVVTNPPFSLFRELIDILVDSNKDFIIVGSQNAITYKNVFPLIKSNRVGVDFTFKGNVGFFNSPYTDTARASQHKANQIRVSGVVWYTTFPMEEDKLLTLTKEYNSTDYPKYDNYKAINVDKVKDIPKDYLGYMGVPITFIGKYNPKQFEIIGADYEVKEGKLPFLIEKDWAGGLHRGYINGQCKYARIIIKRK